MRWLNSSAGKDRMQIADWKNLLFSGDNCKQELRIKHLPMAVAVYAFCLFVVYLSYLVVSREHTRCLGCIGPCPQGKAPPDTVCRQQCQEEPA